MGFTSKSGMHHTPATTMVFQSDEYKKFNMIQGNRSLDMNKIKKILADIERGTNLLAYCPILCVEKGQKLEIVDGQHRYMVARKIKSPVFYIIGTSLSLYDIARMNSNTEKWKAKDFINCYKELGNDNYVKLEKLLTDFPGLPVTTAIALLATGKIAVGGSEPDKFQRGEFVASEQKQALHICKKVSAFDFNAKYSRPFMQAVFKVIEAEVFNIDELIKKVNASSEMLQLQDHWRKYLTSMEEIVSKGKHKRIAIY
jgi:hypothetical protein